MKKFWLFILLQLIPPADLVAHPHVWIDEKFEVLIKDEVVEGIWVEWTFDEMFSAAVMMDFDHRQEGQFDDEESLEVQKGYFDNLKNFHFFSYVYWNGVSLPIPGIAQFRASILDKRRVVYRFFLPVGRKLTSPENFTFAMYDDSNYTDMVLKQEGDVKITVQGSGKASLRLEKNKARSYYAGLVVPTEIHVLWAR